MRYPLFLLSFFALGGVFLSAQQTELVPPEEIEKQLSSAEKEFKEAQEMFDPWYAGPLLTGSAHVIAPGLVNVQPYLFATDTYARFDSDRKVHNIHDISTINPTAIFQIGVIQWMDAIVSVQGVYNKSNGYSAGGLGDSTAGLGFGLLAEGPYNPALLIGIKETFPTGRYEKLSPKKGGIDAVGAGSFQTTVNFNISKVVWWITTHPMNLRLSLNYTVPAPVSVRGFNAYGGGYGTHGTVYPGNTFAVDFGYEFSFTERWVLALDAVYSNSARTRFSGDSGVTASGTPASVGGGSSDQLSFAPALEYNPNANLGFIAGVWFTAWGRNSSDFVSGVFSFTYTF